MTLENWIDVIDKDFPFPKEVTLKHLSNYRSNYYCLKGIFLSTTRELEERRKRALEKNY